MQTEIQFNVWNISIPASLAMRSLRQFANGRCHRRHQIPSLDRHTHRAKKYLEGEFGEWNVSKVIRLLSSVHAFASHYCCRCSSHRQKSFYIRLQISKTKNVRFRPNAYCVVVRRPRNSKQGTILCTSCASFRSRYTSTYVCEQHRRAHQICTIMTFRRNCGRMYNKKMDSCHEDGES